MKQCQFTIGRLDICLTVAWFHWVVGVYYDVREGTLFISLLPCTTIALEWES